MIKPTIGRVVWYWRSEGQEQAFSAQIAYVHSDTIVNLGYLDANGFAKNVTSVQLVQEGDKKPAFSYCEWMPYQIGQAKKHDATETLAMGRPSKSDKVYSMFTDTDLPIHNEDDNSLKIS